MPIWGKPATGRDVAQSQPRKVATPILCPSCRSREAQSIKPAYVYEIVGGEVVSHVIGECVACLRCDTPYVISSLEPGGVIARHKNPTILPSAPPQPPRPSPSDPASWPEEP